MSHRLTLVVVGGGAAGFFSSVIAAQKAPDCRVILLEKSKQLLTKVKLSGGGRCNVTHACFDPKQLVLNYPRGHKALLGPFSRFQPTHTIEWFKQRGVTLKTEKDGRMFPITDSSETIANCLLKAAQEHGVEIRTSTGLNHIAPSSTGFTLTLGNNETLSCDRLLLASGSNTKVWELLKGLGHTIVPPVPSLFTFNVPNFTLAELSGISILQVHTKLKECDLEQTGPLLITHWGFSGPAILKLSAWGARVLHDRHYEATLQINWLPNMTQNELKERLLEYKALHPARLVTSEGFDSLPRNLWKKLIEKAGGSSELRWSHLSKALLQKIIQEISSCEFEIRGKSTYKEEFVTCGGVALSEVDFKRMESKLHPHLHFAGEILDIDGVTGGFNFQNAWTTGFIAAEAML
jgi:predicted Rossmann fold flavoprotein